MKKPIVLVGGGGHCRSCIDVIEQNGDFQIAGIVDHSKELHSLVLGYEVIANDHEPTGLLEQYKHYLIAVGQIKTPEPRIRLYSYLKKEGVSLPVIISPLSRVSNHAFVDEGTIVMHHALVNAGAKVGRNCIINSKALLEHDSSIADHCHISTGAIVNGGVSISTGSFIGSNAVLKEGIEVGENSVIGAGARVMRDVPANSIIRA